MADSVEPKLIAELFNRHAAALALYAAQWTSQADDCVQEALIELAKQPAAPANPAAWLYRVVRNRALNTLRSAKRRAVREQSATTAAQRRAAPATLRVELADVLNKLDDAEREIVALRVWGQFTWQEIAEIVGGSKSAAQRRYVQALEHLRAHWEPKKCPTN